MKWWQSFVRRWLGADPIVEDVVTSTLWWCVRRYGPFLAFGAAADILRERAEFRRQYPTKLTPA